MTAEDAFLAAIRDDPDPVHKLAYADWLAERGQDALAHAYRWAAHRGRHPRLTPKKKLASWGTLLQGQPRPAYSWQLPRLVFRNMKRASNGWVRCRNLRSAFIALAEVLERMRDAYSLEGKPS